MFYQRGYKETVAVVSKFKKPNFPPAWNALFKILFKAFSERVTGNDCEIKLFMGLICGLYTEENVDDGSILLAQLIQSTHSTTRHGEISCVRLWKFIVHRVIQQIKILVMSDALMASIATLHTTGIIVAYPSKFSFIGSTRGNRQTKERKGEKVQRKLPRHTLQKKDILRLATPNQRKQPVRRQKSPTPSLSHSEGKSSESDTEWEILFEENQPVRMEYQGPNCNEVSIPIFTESNIPPQASTAPASSVNVSDTGANTSGFSSNVTPPISPIRTDDPYMISGDVDDDDMGGFTYSPFPIRIHTLHKKIDQLIVASKASSSEAYSKAAVASILERVTKEHEANASTITKAVSESADVCKSTTEKVDKLIADTIEFMEDYKNTYNSNTVTVNKAIQNVGAMLK
uniref:Uncharacterized protein n=1 Tax=Lactuca sativa TaxID=4236 RepID=A0A9R1VKA8_LACSA|nr:hypothetical protein LSAT_V11C400219070 [Lactuca sativa]